MGRAITIGRGKSADLVLSDDTVSRRHALAERETPDTIRITDLGSSNGSWTLRDGTREKARSFVMRLSDTVIFGQKSVSGEDIARAIAKAEAAAEGHHAPVYGDPPGFAAPAAPRPPRVPISPANPPQESSPPQQAAKPRDSGGVPLKGKRPRRHPETNEIIHD